VEKISKRPLDRVYEHISTLFPRGYRDGKFTAFIDSLRLVLDGLVKGRDSPRINGDADKDTYTRLTSKWAMVPQECEDPESTCEQIVRDLFPRVPRWRSPLLVYNVGTAVNSAASAAYSLALDVNVYNINDGLAGNMLVAEQAVARFLAQAGGIEKKCMGLFTFGGTATNLYAMKIGLKKASPGSSRKGTPKDLRVIITEDAHFCHNVSADWLGIGTDNVAVISADYDRRSSIEDAENKMRQIIRSGNLLSSITINGGTTYGHVVDDIPAFVNLRDRLAQEYSLNYRPHLHVDSVIGWAWLMFRNYDFERNELGISPQALSMIRNQYARISQLNLADSWGVDFHKGVGSCPIDCSIFMVNDIADLNLLSKKEGGVIDTHQLAREFSFNSPSDYTLETSRAGGAALAALVSLHTLGVRGYQRNLANVIEQTVVMRDLLSGRPDIVVCHPDASLGYVTMLRIYPPEMAGDTRMQIEFTDKSHQIRLFSESVDKYMKEFFNWDYKNRMLRNEGMEYSFSTSYAQLPSGVKISGIKLYPVSPHFTEKHAREAIGTIMKQKNLFDANVWKK